MTSPRQSEATTRGFARVLGPYLVIVTATALARASRMQALLHEFGSSSVWPWVTGAFVLLGGLLIIALHPYWRSAPAVVVSIVGWLTVLKGLALLAFPEPYISAGESAVDSSSWWQAIMVIAAVAGVYLTYVGWVPARGTATDEATHSTLDLPRAA